MGFVRIVMCRVGRVWVLLITVQHAPLVSYSTTTSATQYAQAPSSPSPTSAPHATLPAKPAQRSPQTVHLVS